MCKTSDRVVSLSVSASPPATQPTCHPVTLSPCHLVTLSLFTIALFQTAPTPASAQDLSEDSVRVVLFAQAAIDDTLVSLGQMSRISGGTEALRKRIAKLDIAEFKLDAAHVVVSSEQVRFRLLLAGIEANRFRLEGAKRTIIVESDDALTLRKVLASAEQALRERYPGDIGNVTITPHKGFELPPLAIGPMDRLLASPRVKTPVPSSGQAHVDVTLLVNGKACEVVPVRFDLEAAPKKTVRSGQGSFAAPMSQPADAKDFLIKSHDNVKIVAKVGSTRIEAVGEAQQDGQVGQIIRVRNVESNRIVHGRVEASGIVLVEY